jgi:hypothetical protein
MEVHQPQHPIHTWREFFIHMGTLVLGLLLALALEQTVEAVHHHRQVRELHESLQQDGKKVVTDCNRVIAFADQTSRQSAARALLIRQAFARHQSLAVSPMQDSTDWDFPTDPAWRAAKASGLVELVPQSDVKVYSEIDSLVDEFAASYPPYDIAARKVARFESRWRLNSASTAIPPEEMQAYLDLLDEKMDTVDHLRFWGMQLRGAQQSILNGERDLSKIQAAER